MEERRLQEEEEKEEKLLLFSLMKSKIICLSKNDEFKEILKEEKIVINILQFFLKNLQIKIIKN